MDELKKKLEEMAALFHQMKADNESRLKQLEAKGSVDPLLEEKLKKSEAGMQALEAEVKRLQTAMNRTQAGNTNTEVDEKAADYKKSFQAYLKRGGNEVELKTMSVDSDVDGGFLVTPEMSSEVIKRVYESSPIRQLASVQSISSDSLEIMEDLDEVGSGWVGEVDTRASTSTPALKMIKIPVHELYAQPVATQKLLDDAAVNVEAYLAGKVAEKFARDEATAFISGDGVKKPFGILGYSLVATTDPGANASRKFFNEVEAFTSGSSGTYGADDLIKLSYMLKGEYKSGAGWMMKRSEVAKLRLFKDSQNRYLWAPGIDGQAPSTFLGFPIYEAADMPSAAASALPIAFGNFKMGYQVVDRIGIRVIRDIYTSKPFVLFYTTKRVGGGIKNFEAIKLLQCAP